MNLSASTRGKPLLLLAFVVVLGGGVLAYNAFYKDQLEKSGNNNSKASAAHEEIINQPRPDFVLRDLEGIPRTVDSWTGKVLVINFWATWCQPCRQEIPLFVEMQKKYGKRGLQIIGIAIDERDPVKEFVEELGVNYPILAGQDDAMDVASIYGNKIGVLPYTAVVSRTGYVHYVHYGELSRPLMEQIINPLL